jgi:phosphoglycolate phosphatase
MLAVGVPWGFRDKKELIENGADYILNKPQDLMHLL